MFSNLKQDAILWIRELRENPVKTLFLPCILLILAFLFRIFAGSSTNLYRLLVCKGNFPGAFMYVLGHILRIFCAGLVLTGILFCRGLFELRLKALACAVIACLVLLTEYRIIFVSVNPVFALLLCAACLAAVFLCFMMFLKTCSPGAFPALMLFIFQFVFFIQLISLCIAM